MAEFYQYPTIFEKASEPRKKCEYCDTGVLHQHIVLIDTSFTDYLLRHGEFKDCKVD